MDRIDEIAKGMSARLWSEYIRDGMASRFVFRSEGELLEYIKSNLTEALAERDARIRELGAVIRNLGNLSVPLHDSPENCPLYYDGCHCLEAENVRLSAELVRIKEGVEKLNVLHIGSLSVGKDVVRKSDLDKLMKSGNNVDPTSPLTIGAGVVPLTIGDGISPLTIDERR